MVQPNGFGKTTLAEFIRAMLYGFPRKSKDLDKSLRQKYTPWNGGRFGGNLVFEYQSRRYRVERTFGENPRFDTFVLIDLETGRRTDRFSEDLGKELFGLDADSFARSTYLPQSREEGPLATASIQAKLTELVEDGSDVANFDKALAALKAKRSALIPYRGNGGSVAETAGRITQLQQRLDGALAQREQYLQLQQETAHREAELIAAQEELSALQQRIADTAAVTEAALRQEQYGDLNSRYREVAAQLAELNKTFPAGIPDPEALTRAETAADRLEILKEQDTTTAADLQAQLTVKQTSHLPSDEQIRHCRRDCETYETLLQRVAAAEQREAQAKKRTAGMIISGVLILTAGIAVAAGGIWLLGLRSVYGIAAVAAGSAAVLMAVVLLLIGCVKKSSESESAAQLRRELESYAVRIGAFFEPHFGIVEPRYFLSSLIRLEHRMAAYAQAQQQLCDWQTRNDVHRAELERCSRELLAFSEQYQVRLGENPRQRLYQLRCGLYDIRTLLSRKQQMEAELEGFRKQHENVLCLHLPPAADPLPLKERETALRSTISALSTRLLQQKQRLQMLSLQTDEIAPMQEEQAYLQQKLAEEREAAGILDATVEFLQQARENLSTAYLGTIRSRFAYYLSQLDGEPEETFLIDPEFQLQLERMGKARELAYFSAGQTDLLMLCMRLALVDALFKEQEVFVVLDDPFVNLDDAHTAQALKLLNQLSAHRQILYLTCHSSRTISK